VQASRSISDISSARLWSGRVLGGASALFLLVDGAMKVPKPAFVVEATVELGYPESVIPYIGIVLLACTVLYLVPVTSVLGAILLTGYLGGAVATHVRVGGDAFNVLFPVLIGAMIWGGLVLRDPRLAALLPLRTSAHAERS
jgi:hypothetical protein